MHGHACTDTRARTRGHGHTDTYGKDGQLWKGRAVMEKTGTYGKDGHLWKRRAVMEKTDTYGKDGHKAFETNFLGFKKEAYTVLSNFINTDYIFILNGCRTCLNQLQTKFTNKNISRVNNTCSFCIYCE